MKTAITLLAALLLAAPASAQLPRSNTGDGDKNTTSQSENLPKKFWEATVPGGSFLVALSSIRNVSLHQYLVDGSVKVHEVVVATDSSTIARFYFGEVMSSTSGIASLTERAKGVASTVSSRIAGTDVTKMVQKNYPASTHAHTVEYRIEYLDDLMKLHSSVRNAWYNSAGTKFTIRNE